MSTTSKLRAWLVVAAGITATVALLAPQAVAITGGDEDRDGHPNVGALLWDTGDGMYTLGCSGTLLADDAFLTAGHCVLGAEPEGLAVSFETDLSFTDEVTEWGPIVEPENTVHVDGVSIHPRFWMPPSGAQSRDDVAVLDLDEPVTGFDPIELPEPWLLADEAAVGGLVGASLVNVGYGVQRFGWNNPTVTPLFDGLRRVSTSPYLGLTKSHLMYLMNERATGEGGICVLDSGGPQFYDGLEVAINTGIGMAPCTGGAIGSSQRLDLPEVLDFLEPWME